MYLVVFFHKFIIYILCIVGKGNICKKILINVHN